MTFIIILIALVIERFFDWGHIRRWTWFAKFQKMVSARLSAWPAYLVLLLILILPVFIVGLLNHVLAGVLYGILKLIFGVVVLVYCLGPMNFWAQAYICISSSHAEAPHPEFETIKNAFGISSVGTPEAVHRSFINALFLEANRRVFAIVFWFILLGPVGAVLYRLLDLCRAPASTIAQPASVILGWLDWLPVRALTLIFALSGHFTKVIKLWKHDVLTAPKMNDTLLTECGIAAMDIMQANQLPLDGSAEKETIAILDRSFVIGLVILAIIVLV